MQKNEVFTFTAPNGAEVTAIVLCVDSSLHQEGTYWVNYLCYAQNKLFYMGQKAVGKPVIESACVVDYTPEFVGELEMEGIVVDYAILPDYDNMLENYQHQIDMANDYADKTL